MRFVVGAATFALLVVGAMGCRDRAAAPPPREAVVAEAQPVVPVDLAKGPVSFFAASCASCHGPMAENHSAAFRTMSQGELRERVAQMISGPAMSEATPEETDALTALQDSMRRGVPHLVITNGQSLVSGTADAAKGELYGLAKVIVLKDGSAFPAVVEGRSWVLKPAPQPPFVVLGSGPAGTVEVRFPKAMWSTAADAPAR